VDTLQTAIIRKADMVTVTAPDGHSVTHDEALIHAGLIVSSLQPNASNSGMGIAVNLAAAALTIWHSGLK